MKAILGIVIAVLGIWAFCFIFLMESVAPDPGTEIVLIDRPFMMGHEGVRPETIKQGREYIWVTTKSYTVQVVPITYHVNFNDLSTKDGNMLDFETSVQLQITNPIEMVTKFGPDWFKNNVQSQYINIVRDVVKTATMSEILYDSEMSKNVDIAIKEQLEAKMKKDGVPVLVMSTLLGRGLPNPDVLKQINETAAARQRQMTITASTAAEDLRKTNEEKRASADNAYRNAMGLNPEQFVQLEQIKGTIEACKVAKSCTLITNPGSVTPTIPVQ